VGILPTEPTPRKTDLSQSTILVFGDVKIGKTEFSSHFPDSIFLAAEAGQGGIECYRVAIDSWPTFLAACGELAQGSHRFRTVIVDTVDALWQLCQRHICEQNKIQHEADMPYGKGYSLVLNEFQRVIGKLSHLGMGVVLISHADREEIQGRTGTYHKAVPSLKDKVRKFLLGLCDLVLYCDTETAPGPDGKPVTRRVLRTKPSQHWESGDRTGLLPETLPLNFDAFRAAFESAVQSQCPAMSGLGNSTASQGDAS
jgi:hypothetical protein